MRLNGKHIVITGASSGIGLSLMRRLCRRGANVIGAARDIAPIAEEFGAEKAIACDVRDSESIDAMIEEAERRLGGIDVYVSNAGIAYYGTIGAPDWEHIEDIFRTNVFSHIYALQRLTQGKKERMTFMLTISGLGKMVLPGYIFYSATKFALDGFVRSYRIGKPKNVRIIPVYPAVNCTPIYKKAGQDTPVPLIARSKPSVTAFWMEAALRFGFRAVYPSLLFILRCILARVTPIDLLDQAIERPRFARWKREHGEK
jgi:NAD(P)-dependent dehydrogenase (short-subunit alcohol dehydrogenase family)